MADRTSDLLNRALARHRAGQLEEAIAIYRALAEGEPENADLHHLLGLARASSNSRASALDFRRALALAPSVALYRYNAFRLAAPADRANRERLAFRALALDPADASIQEVLGTCLLERGDHAMAARAYRRALVLGPSQATPIFDLAILAVEAKDIATARTRYARALAALSAAARDNPAGFDFVATAAIGAGRWPEAVARYSAAAAASKSSLPEAWNRLLVLCGKLGDESALVAIVEAALAAAEAAGEDPGPILRSAYATLHHLLPIKACWRALPRLRALTPASVEMQNVLGFALFQAGDIDGWRKAFRTAAEINEAGVGRHPLAAEGFRILHPSAMVKSVGETALRLSTIVKMRRLGLMRPWRLVLPAPREDIVNEPFLDLFAGDIEIVKDGSALERYQSLAGLTLYSSTPPWADGRFLPVLEAWQTSEVAWRQSGGRALVTPKPEILKRGRKKLAELGLGPNDWFATLHVRDAGFHRETNDRQGRDEAYRNADIATYIPAIARIVDRGGWVVRLGDPSARPLPPMPGLIDYAHASWRSAEMDVAMWSLCRCFIGTPSGPTAVIMCFDKPSVLTNYAPTHCMGSTSDIWISKLYRERDTGRILSLRECLAPPLGFNLRGSALDELGLEVLDNTADEIADAVVEMLDRLDSPPSVNNDPDVAALFEAARISYQAPMAESFLARHRGLLLAQ